MPNIDVNKLFTDIVAAGAGAVNEKWPALRASAENELKTIADTAVDIAKQRIAGNITENEAKVLLEINENALKSVWLQIQGQSKLIAEAAINAIMDVVKGAVNTATGFKLV